MDQSIPVETVTALECQRSPLQLNTWLKICKTGTLLLSLVFIPNIDILSVDSSVDLIVGHLDGSGMLVISCSDTFSALMSILHLSYQTMRLVD